MQKENPDNNNKKTQQIRISQFEKKMSGERKPRNPVFQNDHLHM